MTFDMQLQLDGKEGNASYVRGSMHLFEGSYASYGGGVYALYSDFFRCQEREIKIMGKKGKKKT